MEETLGEVEVFGQSARRRVGGTMLGVERLELSRMATLPVLFGENDIIKSITLLPGVSGEGEGGGGFEVRGGNSSQNLIMLDGMSLYNPSHVMGIFSTFNGDAIGSATLLKGPVPAHFGGGSSAVLETSLERGDMESYHASATIGILAAKIKAEGPIIKDRVSMAVAARRSYVDMFLQMVPQYRGTVMNFYDVTAKLSVVPRYGDYLDVTFMVGHDNMAIKDVMGMHWGNIGASVNWAARIGEKWHSTLTGSFTNYAPDMDMSMIDNSQCMLEYIHNFSLNEKLTYRFSDTKTITMGIRSELLSVKSGEFNFNGQIEKDIRSGWENAAWGEFDGEFNERWGLSAGVRLNLFSTLTSGKFSEFIYFNEPLPADKPHTYFTPEPRITLKYILNPSQNLKIGAGRTSQNLHAVRTTSTSMPFDRYALTSSAVKPENVWQYVAGYSGMTSEGEFDWSAEIYGKQMTNVYDFLDGKTMMSATNIQSIIAGGKGRSYGLELMFRKNNGPLTGWVSYTLSKTETRIDGINDNRWYNASNDRRHNISVTASYRLSPRWSLSASWVYLSGTPLTAPDVKYELSGTTVYYYSERNSYRTPATHHLDLSANYTHRGKRLTYEWNFGIYNAYARYNPFIIYFTDDDTTPSGTRAVQRSLYGLVPSVSYSLKF